MVQKQKVQVACSFICSWINGQKLWASVLVNKGPWKNADHWLRCKEKTTHIWGTPSPEPVKKSRVQSRRTGRCEFYPENDKTWAPFISPWKPERHGKLHSDENGELPLSLCFHVSVSFVINKALSLPRASSGPSWLAVSSNIHNTPSCAEYMQDSGRDAWLSCLAKDMITWPLHLVSHSSFLKVALKKKTTQFCSLFTIVFLVC